MESAIEPGSSRTCREVGLAVDTHCVGAGGRPGKAGKPARLASREPAEVPRDERPEVCRRNRIGLPRYVCQLGEPADANVAETCVAVWVKHSSVAIALDAFLSLPDGKCAGESLACAGQVMSAGERSESGGDGSTLCTRRGASVVQRASIAREARFLVGKSGHVRLQSTVRELGSPHAGR